MFNAQVTTTSAMVWKRKADESEQSAKMLTRLSVILLILTAGSGAYAYSTQSRVSGMCASLRTKGAVVESVSARKMVNEMQQSYCY